MSREYFIALNEICKKIKQYFELSENRSYSRATDKSLNKLPHQERIPDQLRVMSKDIDGSTIRWHSPEDESNRSSCTGSINLLPIHKIYGDWKGIVYFEFTENQRLQDFKIVDFFAEEACVGLYHDAEQDSGLYFYDFERGPYPLHIDLKGYVQLLEMTLGYSYWQKVILDLVSGEESATTRQFRQDMTAWVPKFSFQSFTALYEQVRLP